MKKLFLIITLCFQVSYANDFESFKLIDKNSNNSIIAANRAAITMIEAYRIHPRIKQSNYFIISGQIINYLSRDVSFYIEKESSIYDGCKDAWGFVSEHINKIFLCKLINRLSNDINKIAQVIIHESFHIWEDNNKVPTDEISAGAFEADVTMVALGCIPYNSERSEEAIRVLNKRNAKFCSYLD